MAEKLAKFDKDNRCSKCGSENVNTYYCNEGWVRCSLKQDGEHLHRTCGRCHYEWLESILELESVEEER